MTLFDGKPLTAEEVMRVAVCDCAHIYGDHRGGGNCTKCGCEEFTEFDPEKEAS